MENLGKLLRHARELRGFQHQKDAADAIGISRTSYNRLETGATKELPLPSALHRFEEVLGISVEDMLIAAGYLEVPRNDEAESILVRRDDPRAEVLDTLAGLTDDEVRSVLRILVVIVEQMSARSISHVESLHG